MCVADPVKAVRRIRAATRATPAHQPNLSKYPSALPRNPVPNDLSTPAGPEIPFEIHSRRECQRLRSNGLIETGPAISVIHAHTLSRRASPDKLKAFIIPD